MFRGDRPSLLRLTVRADGPAKSGPCIAVDPPVASLARALVPGRSCRRRRRRTSATSSARGRRDVQKRDEPGRGSHLPRTRAVAVARGQFFLLNVREGIERMIDSASFLDLG
jgi:hypothetical protein